MIIPEENLLEDVRKSLEDPVYDILQNFSLEKSKEHYNKWAIQWNMWDFRLNLANKQEEEKFPFNTLAELAKQSEEAQNLFNHLLQEDFFKGCEWAVYWQNVVVRWNRLKTFDEWLYDWLKDAITMHYKEPEEGVRKILHNKLGKWYYGNTAIHMFAEWLISKDVLLRAWQYEEPQKIEWRDLEADIEAATKALYDINLLHNRSDNGLKEKD